MHRQFRKWITAALAVCVLLHATLPAALAAEEDGAPAATGSLTVRSKRDEADGNDKEVYYTIPEALPGETCTLYVPLQCAGSVTGVTCEAEAAGFPAAYKTPSDYAAAAVGGGASIDALSDGQKAYFSFTVTVADDAKAGDYAIPMLVHYQVNGADAAPLRAQIACKVKAVAPAPTPTTAPTASPAPVEEIITYESGSSGGSSGGGSGFRTKPKVIVSAYSFDVERLYAGEQVTLSLQLRNTSKREAVRNLELKFSNEAGVVMPVSGGSNSIYIGELKKDTSATIRIPLAIAPEADAKAQALALEIVYEGTKNKQEFTEKSSLTMPIYQRARVRFDQPQVYDEAWAGQSVSMSVQMFNMGKSTLYNCMVEIQGDGLSLEETYYGGNIASGSTMRADLTVLTATAGTIDGNVRITYEDVFGEQSESLLPFTLAVNEELPPMDMDTEPGMPAMADGEGTAPQDASALLRYWWVALLVLLGVVLLILISLQKRRRARLLADDMPDANGDDDWERLRTDAPDDDGSHGNEA